MCCMWSRKFGTGHFQEAIKYYTKSLEHTPTAPVYGNRAFCQLKLVCPLIYASPPF